MRLLDLFCGAGGAAMGYHRAGFEVVGVDIKPQKNYPFRLFECDAIRFLDYYFGSDGFDVIHASPPCQAFTKARRLQGNNHPDLIAPIRDLLIKTGKPYVIENVPSAPLINPTMLCGEMFGLMVYRHRLFESNFELPFMLHAHSRKQTKLGMPSIEGEMVQVVGHFSNVPYGRKAMGIDWMNQHELAQAIPPAYTEWIGNQLLKVLK
jgi:DNA (cytosine-5)-methyltransferase 1